MTNRILESFSNTITVNLSSGGIVSIDVNDNVVNANNALYIGGLPATNVVSNAQLIANLALYAHLASPALTGTPTAPIQTNPFDSSNQIATDSFVQNSLLLSMSAVPMTLTNGTYSFASTSTNLPVMNITATGNVVTGYFLFYGGGGLKPGDLLTPYGGNHDAILQVNAVSSNVVSSFNIVYGGTGYVTGSGITSEISSAVPYTFILSGVLTGNCNFLMSPGTYQTGSQQWFFINNTTGNYSVNVAVANSSNLPTGGRTAIIPQGTGSSRLVGVETDSYNVDICSIVNSTDLIPGVTNTSTAATLNIGTWKINTGLVVTNSSGSNVVTFNTSFIKPPYSVIVEPVATVYSAIASVNSVSNTGVTINSAVNTGLTNTGIQGVYYTAIGY